MFKNLIVYRVTADDLPSLEEAHELLLDQAFAPCGATQLQSSGFVPPRGRNGAALVEGVSLPGHRTVKGTHWLMRVATEQRLLPGSVVRDRVQETAERIEAETGRRPGKKQLRDIKDDITLVLLPQAFTKTSHNTIWLDARGGWLYLDCGSMSKADALVTLLVSALPGLTVKPLHTQESPATCMAAWLMDGDTPEGFTIDRDCELRSLDESHAKVRYGKHPLDIDNVREHLKTGKRPTRVAFTWRDRVSFVLTDALQVKAIKFLVVALASRERHAGEEAFDADAALVVGELGGLLPAIVDALGGDAAIKKAEAS